MTQTRYPKKDQDTLHYLQNRIKELEDRIRKIESRKMTSIPYGTFTSLENFPGLMLLYLDLIRYVRNVDKSTDILMSKKMFNMQGTGTSGDVTLSTSYQDLGSTTVAELTFGPQPYETRVFLLAQFDFNCTVTGTGLIEGQVFSSYNAGNVGGVARYDSGTTTGRVTAFACGSVLLPANETSSYKLRARKTNAGGTAVAQGGNCRIQAFACTT